ncbi:MAG: glycosyltransferase family 39 protein [Candidatus Moraniibacteriota bacterium]|nr:MAG: glycosyltransferase family 39 protein [Candidatus Moranbacteria bacterium]
MFRKPSAFRTAWILCGIVVVGIFIRTYHFREWLHFGSDQARDVMLVGDVVHGVEPWPLLGMEAGNTRFDLGPVYYYFQIASAHIFGVRPDTLAYPDLLFSILTIPLAFFLFRKLFETNLSLALTGLYSISFYIVEYSRFAWNPNMIPFFVGLFLLSLTEFMEADEKTKWRWIFALGIAIGIGVQLHTILLFLFPAMLLGMFLIFSKKNIGAIVRLVSIVAIAFALNIPQAISEVQTHGKNTKLFFKALTDRSGSGSSQFAESLKTDILCHAQANSHMLSALGHHGNCNFLSLIDHPERFSGGFSLLLAYGSIMLSVIFSAIGYGLLAFLVFTEADPKRRKFLLVIFIYTGLSFLILFSVIIGAPLRYFIHATFIPFILLGLILVRIRKYSFPFARTVVWAVIATSALLNVRAIGIEASQLASGTRGNPGFVVLGEAERMVDYMRERSGSWTEANLAGGTAYFSTYYKPLKYIAAQKGLDIHLAKRKRPPVSEIPYFFVYRPSDRRDPSFAKGYDVLDYRDFGQIGIYHLQSVKYRVQE